MLMDKVRDLISKEYVVTTLTTIGLNGSRTTQESRPLTFLEREMAQALITIEDILKRSEYSCATISEIRKAIEITSEGAEKYLESREE